MKSQSLKVQINATDDTVCMKYLRPSQNTKIEGFVLGYGSSFFSNQYIPLPSEGKTYTTELGKAYCLCMPLLSWIVGIEWGENEHLVFFIFIFIGLLLRGFCVYVYLRLLWRIPDQSGIMRSFKRTNSSCCLEKFTTGVCFEGFHCSLRLYYTDHSTDQMGWFAWSSR